MWYTEKKSDGGVNKKQGMEVQQSFSELGVLCNCSRYVFATRISIMAVY